MGQPRYVGRTSPSKETGRGGDSIQIYQVTGGAVDNDL